MKIRKQMLLFGALSLLFFVACERDTYIEEEIIEETDGELVLNDDAENVDNHDAAADYTWNNEDVIAITLNGSSTSVSGSGATASGSKVTVTTAGTYSFSGTLSDGQIVVDTEDEAIVRLIFNGINISCSSNAPVYVENAEKAMIVLAADTKNTVADGSSYSSDEEDANAAIFSKSDLTIFGEGSLAVTGNYADGITSKDGLVIASGNITVNAVDDGIRGKDYLIVNNGNLTVMAGGDGLKSDNIEDEGRGYVTINDGVLDITASGDAVYGGKDVLVVTGDLDLTSGGGSNANLSASASAKGIKSGVMSQFYGGTISVNAADDGIHSDGDTEIYGGTFSIASGDDGIHSEYDLTIESGDIYITESYEGLESAQGSIIISGGYMNIIASDDGTNVSAGGASSGGGWRKSATASYALDISGGYMVIDCEGDGLDSNDVLTVSGGTQIVNSDSQTENSSLDYDGSCVVSGGFLLGVGSSRMSKAPGSSSTQYSFMVDFKSKLSGGNTIHVKDSEGTAVLTYKTQKAFQSLVFSSSALKKGSTYEVYVGGSSNGTETDGLYSSGNYSGGTKYTEFTISNMVTTISL